MRYTLASIAWLLLASASLQAGTHVFVGQVIGDRANGFDVTVLRNFLGDQHVEEIGQGSARIAKNVIDRLDAHREFTHYARPVEVYDELPDDVLLMVLAVEGASEDRLVTRQVGNLQTIVTGVSLQLVDPRTGQAVYSDFEVLNTLHHTTVGGEMIPTGVELPQHERGLYIQQSGGFVIPDATAADGTRVVSRPFLHLNLAKHAVNRLLSRMLDEFRGTPTITRVVRRVDRERGLFLLDRGRIDGVFPGTRLAAADGGLVLNVTESRPTYSLASVIHGDPVALAASPWTDVQGYLPSTGSGTVLTTVGRFVLSPSVCNHPRLAGIANDEVLLTKRLDGIDGPGSLTQSLLASRTSSALSQTGRFRMMSPAGSLAPIKRAKSRLNTALNLKQRPGDPLFYESLVIPDRVVSGFATAPTHQYTTGIESGTGNAVDWRRTSRWLIDGGLTLTGVDPTLLIATGKGGPAANGKNVEWSALTGMPVLYPASDHDTVIRECLLGSFRDTSNMTAAQALIPSAVTQLAANYDPIGVIGTVTDADEAEVEVKFFDPAVATLGEVVEVCANIGKIPLDSEGGRVTTILRGVGRARVADQEGDKWYLDVIEWDADTDPGKLASMGAVVPLYGRNAMRTDPLRLGRLELAATTPDEHPLTEVDAQLLLLAATSQHPELPVVLPPYLVDRISKFNHVKFVVDVAYRDAEKTIRTPDEGSNPPPPGHTLTIDIGSLEAPVVEHKTHATEKTLALNCGFAMRLERPDGSPACDSGAANTTKQKVVSVADYDGQAGGQVWLSQTLPKYMKFFRTKKMEQMP